MTAEIYDNYLGSYRIKLDPQFVLDRHVLEKGVWESHVVLFINYFVKPGQTCIDVGANSGYHTLPMAGRVGPLGRVIAFEPNDLTYNRLLDNLSLNPDLAKVTTCEKKALSYEPGELKVFQAGNEPSNAYVSAEYNEKLWNGGGPEDYQVCDVIRLDTYMGAESAHFLKIDVEGMELEVLMGAEGLLERDRPVIVFETLIDDFDKAKIKRTEELLRSHGYLLFGMHFERKKMTPTTFPYFQEDTLAIHETQIVEAAEIMLSAAKFVPLAHSASHSEGLIKEIVIVTDDRLNFYVKISDSRGISRSWHCSEFIKEEQKVELTEGQGGRCTIVFGDEEAGSIRVRVENEASVLETTAVKAGGKLILL
ncbi:MAG: FkbM family methyltransferase [Deltaproteobacteria bacterium]|nr:FkbM family methyltransferase [Deltaproteobacteria bacterium]